MVRTHGISLDCGESCFLAVFIFFTHAFHRGLSRCLSCWEMELEHMYIDSFRLRFCDIGFESACPAICNCVQFAFGTSGLGQDDTAQIERKCNRFHLSIHT